MYRNGLTTLDADIFDGLSALTDLGLSSNQLTTLDAGIFDGLSALEYLSLGDNPLPASLPASLFADLPATATIILPDGVTVNAAVPTAVGEISDIDLKINVSVFPNPIKDRVKITVDGGGAYRLLETSGKTLTSGTLTKGDNNVALPSLIEGIYLLKIQTKLGSTTRKVVKK